MKTGILEWLRTQSTDDLVTLLGNRPDCLSPLPRSLNALGDRLSGPTSVRLALQRLDRGCLDLLEAMRALGDGTGFDAVRRFIDVGNGTADSDYERARNDLQRHALIWPQGDGKLRLAGPLRNPEGALRLGASLRTLLKPLTVAQLKSMMDKLSIEPNGVKQRLIDDLSAVISDSQHVSELIATAPTEARDLAEILAWRSPRIVSDDDGFSHYREVARGGAGQRWLMERGLLLPAAPPAAHGAVEMAREVALALRGSDYRAPLTPRPPEPETVATDGVDSHASAAASSTVDGVSRLLELALRQPVTKLRTGGVGVRELRRLAKALQSSEDSVRLWVEIASAAGLLFPDEDGIRPTSEGELWRKRQPAERIGPLLMAWWDLAYAPTSTASSDKSPPALLGSFSDDNRQFRHEALRALVQLEAGRGLRDRNELDRLLVWKRPYIDVDNTHALWTEAEQLGVVAQGALSRLGEALVAGELDEIAAVARDLLPAAEETMRLQADLTAIVGGTPSADLTALLDLVADQQQRDTASVWRFSASSIRRALDGGYSATDLLAELRAVSTSDLPQPLEYLINDTARRHGEVEVVPVGCCVVGRDEATLAEIHRHRALKELAPRLLAPTVLASRKSVAETVKLLRQAGYAPLQRNSKGDVVIERSTSRVAPEPPAARPLNRPRAHDSSVSVAVPDLRRLAEKLLDPGEPELPWEDAAAPDDLETRIAEQNPRLSEGERIALADALRHHSQVEIDYVDQNGTHSVRTITPTDVVDHWLEAYCHLRNGERNFRIERIRGITNAV
jgi:hypothetical protein